MQFGEHAVLIRFSAYRAGGWRSVVAGFCARAAAIVVTNFSLVWEQIVVAALPGGMSAEGDEVLGMSVEADDLCPSLSLLRQNSADHLDYKKNRYCLLMPGYL